MENPNIFDQEIVQTTLIRAPIAKVYEALTTSKGLDAWFTKGAKVDQEEGGQIYFRWELQRANVTGGVVEDGGRILKRNVPDIFSFEWHPDNSSYATTVTLTFESIDEGTIVKVTETGFQDTPSGRKALIGCATGWGEALTMVKYYLEHGIRY